MTADHSNKTAKKRLTALTAVKLGLICNETGKTSQNAIQSVLKPCRKETYLTSSAVFFNTSAFKSAFKDAIMIIKTTGGLMSYQILTTTAASITDLKKNPMGTVAEGEGDAVAILNRNEPAFYCVPPKLYAYYRELAEDAELNAVADERMKNPEIVKVNLDDL